MTCIAALKHEGKIYVASDCQTSYGGTSFIDKTGKVFKKGNMLVGISGDARFSKIFRYNFNIPEHNNSIDDMEYLNSVFVDSLRELCNKKEHSTVISSKSETDSVAIIGYNKNIYTLACDYDVSIYDQSYKAVGSGKDLAMGALYATEGLDMEPEKRLELAVKSAIAHNTGCGGYVVIISS